MTRTQFNPNNIITTESLADIMERIMPTQEISVRDRLIADISDLSEMYISSDFGEEFVQLTLTEDGVAAHYHPEGIPEDSVLVCTFNHVFSSDNIEEMDDEELEIVLSAFQEVQDAVEDLYYGEEIPEDYEG